MAVHIHTGYNSAFKWICSDNFRFIGYINNDAQLIPSVDFIRQLFVNCHTYESFKKIIQSLNGVFSVIVENENALYAASCPIRFFPLFYALNSTGDFIISDNIKYVKNTCDKHQIDPLAKIEFLSGAFTCDKRTLYQEIYQVRPGEIVQFDNNEIKGEYYYHFSKTEKDLFPHSFDRLELNGQQIIDTVFNRQFSPLINRKVALALSGGYDSRLIAVKLKEFGFRDVVCFTYGRPTAETKISERVAKILGFKWHFVEYTSELIQNFNKTEDFNRYYEYASRGTSMFYLQEYPAIKNLLDNNIITNDYITFPGHSGGLIRGTFLVKYFPEYIDREKIPLLLFKQKFFHSSISATERSALLHNLKSHLNELHYTPDLLPYSILEDWELKERTTKYIFNSSHAFTFFGIQTFFPLADIELLNFFRALSFQERRYGHLYKTVLSKSYFKPAGLDFTNDIQPSKTAIRIDSMKRKIRPYLPKRLKQKFLIKNDWPFYGPMTKYLQDELHKNNIYPKTNYSSYLYRILHWYLMKIDHTQNPKTNN